MVVVHYEDEEERAKKAQRSWSLVSQVEESEVKKKALRFPKFNTVRLEAGLSRRRSQRQRSQNRSHPLLFEMKQVKEARQRSQKSSLIRSRGQLSSPSMLIETRSRSSIVAVDAGERSREEGAAARFGFFQSCFIFLLSSFF